MGDFVSCARVKEVSGVEEMEEVERSARIPEGTGPEPRKRDKDAKWPPDPENAPLKRHSLDFRQVDPRHHFNRQVSHRHKPVICNMN